MTTKLRVEWRISMRRERNDIKDKQMKILGFKSITAESKNSLRGLMIGFELEKKNQQT